MSATRRWLAPLAGIFAIIAVWELYVRLADVKPIVLPAPSRIVSHIVSNPGFYANNTATTLVEALSGLLIGFIAAAAVASAMAHSRTVERFSWPLIVTLQSVPIVVVAPLFLIWFGFGLMPKALIVAMFVFVPFATNILAGLRSTDPALIELARSVDASDWSIYRRLQVPSALADGFAAARIAVPLSLVGAVIGEFYGGSVSGLGYQTRSALSRLDIDVAWGSIVTLAAVGIVGTLLTVGAERRALQWHPSYRTETSGVRQ